LRYLGKVGVVAIGGSPGSANYDICSFPGGSRLDWNQVVNQTKGYTFIDYLPTTAITSFTYTEVYMGQQSVPREFAIINPDYRLYVSNNVNDLYNPTFTINLYSNISTLFGSISYGPLGPPFQSKFPNYNSCLTSFTLGHFLISVILALYFILQ